MKLHWIKNGPQREEEELLLCKSLFYSFFLFSPLHPCPFKLDWRRSKGICGNFNLFWSRINRNETVLGISRRWRRRMRRRTAEGVILIPAKVFNHKSPDILNQIEISALLLSPTEDEQWRSTASRRVAIGMWWQWNKFEISSINSVISFQIEK